MARYLTTEDLHKCPQCATRFALRESKHIKAKQIGFEDTCSLYECPGCKDCYLLLDSLTNKVLLLWYTAAHNQKKNLEPMLVMLDG